MNLFAKSIFLSLTLWSFLFSTANAKKEPATKPAFPRDEKPTAASAAKPGAEPTGKIAMAPESASPKDDGQWTSPAKDFANTRYSELTEINTTNVKDLKVAFTVPTGTTTGQESAPIVVGDTLYFVTPYPNNLFAIDLSKGGAVKWKYEPKPDPAAQGETCCEAVNRGAVYANGTIYYNTVDAFTVAVDAKTGQLKWKVKLADFTKGVAMTGAPFVVRDKVYVGNSDADFGARGWLTALNAKDGSIAWRAYGTGPDKDVLIDPTIFKPFYPQYKGKDLGVKEWPADAWKIGGATSWGWISYDPDQNLLLYGTANPAPWNEQVRPGDNLWSNGVFARDPETGQAHWFYQYSPHDLWDHDGVNENVILDLPWGGTIRKVIVHPERNGYMYVVDRTNGEVLAADPYVFINTTKGVDLKSGRLIRNEAKAPKVGKVTRNVCPNAPGAKDWNPSAFGKDTGYLFVPHNNLCMDWEETEVSYLAGTPYIGTEGKYYPGPGGNAGAFMAWDPVARKKVWEVEETWPVWSGAAATAGGLVFYGNLEGYFKALDAKTGKTLWQFKTGSGIIGQPSVFKGPDGHEYVAILSGIGGWVGSMVTANLDPRDKTAESGFANFNGKLKDITTKGGTLYVFKLP
jgi:PQQ-dependent dehydrogenase (methanol/ethanol family)